MDSTAQGESTSKIPSEEHTPNAGAATCFPTFSVNCLRSLIPSYNVLWAILLGQFLSILIAGTGITSQQLVAKYSVNAPSTQSFINYALLNVYGIVLCTKGQVKQLCTDKLRLFSYLILAFVDVEANYLVVKAYQYTDITSVMLLDSFSIPCVMVLSFFVLKMRFRYLNYIGVVICFLGLIILILSDALTSNNPEATKPILGDALCLIGASLYSISNVGQEKFVNQYSKIEYLSMIGFFGSLISGAQLLLLERGELETLKWNWQIGSLFLAFGLCLFLLYSLTPILLTISTATVMNLSLLTSDVLGIIAGIYIFNYKPSVLYYLAFVVIILGIFIYNMGDRNENPHKQLLESLDESHEEPEVIVVDVSPSGSKEAKPEENTVISTI